MSRIYEIFESGELFDGHYKLLELLSTAGGSADVWLAIDLNTVDDTTGEEHATKVVIKVYRPKNIIDVEGEFQFRSEFKKVFNCHHENIIQPTYFSIYEEMPYLVLPYCPAGSSELLVGQLVNGEDLWKYIYDVASGLAYLHEHTPQIVHQDIKPANVLIDDNGNYAITDFGISAALGDSISEQEDESGGTFAYMAPERFAEGTIPMPQSDIWAFGATLYELISGDVPFGDEGGSRQTKDTRLPAIKKEVPDAVRQLIVSCLAYDPQSRPTARSIVDTVLKKRYARHKRTVTIVSTLILVIIACVISFFMLRPTADPTEYWDMQDARADSILTLQITYFKDTNYVPSEANIKELEKAKGIYTILRKDASPDYVSTSNLPAKIKFIDELIREIRDCERAGDLAEMALQTDMEDEYYEYSLVRENHRNNINRLIRESKKQ